jgi:hydroxypyruvate reductase
VSLDLRSPRPDLPPAWGALLDILAAALRAADPAAAVHRALAVEGATLRGGSQRVDLDTVEHLVLVAAGKAATAMVRAAEEVLGDRVATGVAVTAYGAGGTSRRTAIREAGHPLPDPAGLVATRQILRLLERTTDRDLVLVLLSGGASALLEQPAGRIPLVDLATATSALLASGATIREINTVRKHVSAVKGGGLARRIAPARLLALALSDVVGDPLEVIASGPTVPDPTTFADAAAVLSRYRLWGGLPESIHAHLHAGLAGQVAETAKPGDACFERAWTEVIGGNGLAVAAAVARAQDLGYRALPLAAPLEGEAREAGRALAAMGQDVADHGRPLAAPACLVAGGETTVTLRHLGGVGGRNQELALAAALALDGREAITLAAMGTDGIDGATEAAGALVDGRTVARARVAGLDPLDALEWHNSGPFFEQLGDQIVTGPTGTNVNDLAVVLVRYNA